MIEQALAYIGTTRNETVMIGDQSPPTSSRASARPALGLAGWRHPVQQRRRRVPESSHIEPSRSRRCSFVEGADVS